VATIVGARPSVSSLGTFFSVAMSCWPAARSCTTVEGIALVSEDRYVGPPAALAAWPDVLVRVRLFLISPEMVDLMTADLPQPLFC